MRDVLQNTARKFKIYMADSASPTSAKTGLSSFTVYLAKDNGAENTVSPTITERGHGWYEVTPTTSHRDTLGENAWTFTATGAIDFPYKETVVAVDDQVVSYGAIQPTTPGRTLDVSAGGEAGVDWANVGSPTTTVNLSGTTVKTATDVETDTQDLQSRIPAALIGGRMDATVGAMQNNVIVAAAIQSGALSGKGDWATNSQVSALQVNTRANLMVPVEIETPDSGTAPWKIRLHLFDVEGNMEAPDVTPTVSIFSASGTNRSSRLSAATLLSTGAYEWTYTSTAGDAEEQLIWTFVVIEGGATRQYTATSYVVEETAYRFSSSDRNNLNTAVSQTAAAAIRSAVGLTSANLESLLTTIDTVVDGIAVVSTRHNTMLELDGVVYRYTVNALEQAPSGGGGGGGGDATEANQLLILNAIAGLGLIALETSPDVVTGMPSTLTIGNDYVDDINAHIPIYIRDDTGTPITSLGTKNFSDVDFAPEVIFDCGATNNQVRATVTWVPPSGPTEGYLKVEIPASQSSRAVPGTSVMQLTFRWTGIVSVRSRQDVEWVERT